MGESFKEIVDGKKSPINLLASLYNNDKEIVENQIQMS